MQTLVIEAWIFLGHLADNGGNDPDLRDGRSRTDVYFSYCRVLDGLDFPDPLPEFIEDGDASLDEYAAYGIGSTPLELRSKRDTPSVCSMSEMDLETAGSDIASWAAAFAMLPACATASRTSNSWSLSRLTRWSPGITRPIRFSYMALKR